MAWGKGRQLGASAAQLEPRHWQLLGLLGTTSFFEGYDLNVVIFALPHIRASFHLSQSSAALWLSLLYLGALPAVALARQADRFGRRRLLLVSITGYTLATAATAAAPSIVAFAVCQFAARFFLAAELSLTWTVVSEELPAGARGFGFGYLATLDILGAGAGSLLYGLVLAPMHVSWRWLYWLAVPVLAVLVWLRRRLPESSRFLQVAEQGSWSPARAIARPPHRRNLILVCLMAMLVNLTTQANVFVVDFLQSQRHLSTSAANLVVVASGAIAIPTMALAGSLSDRVGRKRVGCAFVIVGVTGLWILFFLAHSTPALLGGLTLVYIGGFGAWPALGAFGAELFPTSLRAFGASAAVGSKVVGQCLSFVVAGVVISTSSLPHAVAVLAIGPILGIVLVAGWFPETRGRDVDEITNVLALEKSL